MKPLPVSLKIAFVCASVACVSTSAFFIGGGIYTAMGWQTPSYWPDLFFQILTAVSWFSCVATAVVTLVATWSTRRYLIALGKERNSN
jgi:hypothetical protein